MINARLSIIAQGKGGIEHKKGTEHRSILQVRSPIVNSDRKTTQWTAALHLQPSAETSLMKGMQAAKIEAPVLAVLKWERQIPHTSTVTSQTVSFDLTRPSLVILLLASSTGATTGRLACVED
jgi:hypothetical protein